MNQDLSAHYILVNDIDASDTSSWYDGAGFEPIGSSYTYSFTDTLDGNGHKITGLYINRPNTSYVGLFGYTHPSGVISNIVLENIDISGSQFVGGLVGDNYYYPLISNSYWDTETSGQSQNAGGIGKTTTEM